MHHMAETKKTLLTVDVEPDEHTLIKPGELIDIVELSPLTLQDRRIYNLLILNAWDSITELKEHRIHKRDLRGAHNVNDRVGDSLLRLMGAIAQLRIERDAGEGVETFMRRVQLLAGTEESARSNGVVFYSFPAAVRSIIQESSQYARLQKQVMFAFSSKYALALYEIVQKRGNLKYKTSEEFPLDRFRSALGVESGKLSEFKHFKNRAIDPAALEVNGLGEFGCKVEPVYAGRKVTGVRLSWWAKNLDERKHALNELRHSRIGRRARLKGEVATVFPATATSFPHPPQDVIDNPFEKVTVRRASEENQRDEPSQFVTGKPIPIRDHKSPKVLLPPGQSGLTDKQAVNFRRDFPGLDVPWLEREFRAWVEEHETPKDYSAAFYGFMKRKRAEAG